ncbi:MAG: hypothetical protein OXC69_06465 [Candidatus Tectomicrobia bacterium]|nr:hypothetical protein [Candidatus Tectomicrobia bacterium]
MIGRHYRWLIVAYTLIIQAVAYGALIYSFALFAVPWLEAFDVPRRDLMLAVAALQVCTGLISPIAGRAMDRYPLRNIVFLGLG